MLDLNQSELQRLIEETHGVKVPKLLATETMLEVLGTEEQPRRPKHRSMAPEAKQMEAHIQKYFRRLKSQLPHCTGLCTSHGCPDIIVARCWNIFKDHII